MKKIILTLFTVIFAAAIISCNVTTPENIEYTDVVYSEDGSYITLYINGTVPVTEQQRALTTDRAKFAHDYFEVVFKASGTTVRTSWERGESAGISGVPRATYNTGTVGDTGTDNTAILLVGRKTGKVLLGIGTINGVTGSDGLTTTGATITDSTVSVTFEVQAFNAGAGFTVGTSSWSGGTLKTSAYTNGITKSLPIHEISDTAPTTIVFTLGPAGIDEYLNGIFVHNTSTRNPETSAKLTTPKFVQGGVSYELKKPWAEDCDVEVTTISGTLGDSTTGGSEGKISITITPGTDKGLSALYFEFPVYAVSATDCVNWIISTGIGTSLYDIDDGTNGAGGALLLSVGTASDYIDILVGP